MSVESYIGTDVIKGVNMNRKYLFGIAVWYGLLALIGGSALAWEWELGYKIGFMVPAIILLVASLLEK